MSDAWIAIWAVSLSRISPTSTTSGSCRRIERRAEANVRPGFLVHLDLHDVLPQPVLDRILDGDDVGPLALDQLQGGVERRRLPGSRWAGDEDDPFIVSPKGSATSSRSSSIMPSASRDKLERIGVEDSNDHLLAQRRRKGRDA